MPSNVATRAKCNKWKHTTMLAKGKGKERSVMHELEPTPIWISLVGGLHHMKKLHCVPNLPQGSATSPRRAHNICPHEKLLQRGQCTLYAMLACWVMLLVCMGKTCFGGIIYGEVVMMHAQKFPLSMYFLPMDHMSMNSELLAPGTGVFYLRGTTNERVPTTSVGSSSKADCVPIQYERSGHSKMGMSLETKPGQVYFCACSIFSTHYISFLLVVRAVAPFVSQANRPPCRGCGQLQPSTL